MAEMTDPTPAMLSFQQALTDGEVRLHRAALDPDVFVHMDLLKLGQPRFTYVRMQGTRVVAFANFVMTGREDGVPVFQIGVAVPEPERGKGRAKHIVAAGIAEMKHGFNGAHPGATFDVEAVVGVDNVPSLRVATAVISDRPKPITDGVSGQAALHFVRRI